MSDTDLLQRAARELRRAHPGERSGAALTRARILVSARRERRKRLVRWFVVSPLTALALAGSAWAHANDKWPEVWRAVMSVLTLGRTSTERERAPAAPKPRSRAVAPPARSETRASDAGEAPSLLPAAPRAPEPEAAPPPSPSPEPARAPALGTPSELRSAPPRRRAARAAPADEASIEPPTPDPAPPRAAEEPRASEPAEAESASPELAAFRRAYELDVVRREPRAAIAAYERYLAAYPRGRFVPEARYNLALRALELGDKARARRELEPFAAGDYGNYRQGEARALIDAMR